MLYGKGTLYRRGEEMKMGNNENRKQHKIGNNNQKLISPNQKY